MQALRAAEATSQKLQAIFGDEPVSVLNGPFQGMNYITVAHGSQLLPKIVGAYEEPIHRWVEQIKQDGTYDAVIDVGSAEGYYAVGFALANQRLRVIAIDMDAEALEAAKMLAEINEARQNLQFADAFDNNVLRALFDENRSGRVLLFVDVEGAENNLLNPDNVPLVLNCDVLVELHDCFVPGTTERVIGFFQATHQVELVVDYPWRNGPYFVNGHPLDQNDVDGLLDERRPPAMRWMFARRKR